MTIQTSRFDASEFLDDAASQAELLADAFETNDPKAVAHVLGVIARAKGMTELSKSTGISRSALYAALADDGNPTIDTFMKVMTALNITLTAKPAESAEIVEGIRAYA